MDVDNDVRAPSRNAYTAHLAQSGSSMIEVLISILIVSIGLIGLLGLLSTSMQSSNNAQDRNKAAILANELVTAMWLHQTTDITNPALSGEYAAWKASINNTSAGGLYGAPYASGKATSSGNSATITITWSPPNQAGSKASNSVNSYTNQVVNNVYTTQVTF